MYEKNVELLRRAVEDHKAIRNIAYHRKPDGTLDVEGNMQLWNDCMEPFEKIQLWPEGAPGYDGRDPLQEQPYIVFIPAEGNCEKSSAGETIIIAHGGGFSWRTGCEGVNVAWYFHQAGFNTAILSYRLLPYTRLDAMADMQRAIRILRSEAEMLQISGKVAVMGFSAGGMLAANCATHFDYGISDSQDVVETFSCHPDACVVGYGAFSGVSFPAPVLAPRPDGDMMGTGLRERLYLAPEKNIKFDTPPMFIWQTLSDDGRHGMCLAKAMEDAGIPYELHIFQSGVHGLAMADGENDLAMNIPHITHWGELCCEWLEEVLK